MIMTKKKSKNKELAPIEVSQSPEKKVGKKMGRPKGAKNKDTIFKELMKGDFQELATQEVGKVFKVLFAKAQDGDMQAIKLVLDRVVPPNKAVEMADKGAGGFQIAINIGKLEDSPLVTGEVIEDAEYEEIEE